MPEVEVVAELRQAQALQLEEERLHSHTSRATTLLFWCFSKQDEGIRHLQKGLYANQFPFNSSRLCTALRLNRKLPAGTGSDKCGSKFYASFRCAVHSAAQGSRSSPPVKEDGKETWPVIRSN